MKTFPRSPVYRIFLVVLLLDLINYGELLRVQHNSTYNYMQEYYKFDNKLFIATKKGNDYIYIERM